MQLFLPTFARNSALTCNHQNQFLNKSEYKVRHQANDLRDMMDQKLWWL